MHRPHRRPRAAASRTFFGGAVTPTPGPTPVASVTTTFATTAQAALAGPVPPHGTRIKIPAHQAGGIILPRAVRPLFTGRPVQGQQMRSSYLPAPACHTDASAHTSTGMTPSCSPALFTSLPAPTSNELVLKVTR